MNPGIATAHSAAHQKISNFSTYLNGEFFERASVVDATLTALVAGEHLALIGPPGIAKSAVINAVSKALNAHLFEYLLTRFTEPNEVFGPVDIAKFKSEGKYLRNTTGMLPTCQLAFLDEAFKANSAILNALLTLLNERRYDNGGTREIAPLRTALLASNELPGEANLAALWDRCLLRVMVKPIQEESNWVDLCFTNKPAQAAPDCGLDDFAVLGAHAQTLTFSSKAVDACRGVKNKLTEKGIHVSDRRWKKAAQNILRSYAALKGAQTEVTEEHLDILRFVLWEKEADIPVIDGIVEEFAAAWIAASRELAMKLDEAAGRLNAAKTMAGGARLRALADLTDLVEPLVAEAQQLHKQYPRKETAALVQRAGGLTTDATNVARGK